MAKNPVKTPSSDDDQQVRLKGPAGRLLARIKVFLEEQARGDAVTYSDVIHHALRLLAKELNPDLLDAPSAAELLSRASGSPAPLPAPPPRDQD